MKGLKQYKPWSEFQKKKKQTKSYSCQRASPVSATDFPSSGNARCECTFMPCEESYRYQELLHGKEDCTANVKPWSIFCKPSFWYKESVKTSKLNYSCSTENAVHLPLWNVNGKLIQIQIKSLLKKSKNKEKCLMSFCIWWCKAQSKFLQIF